MGRTYITDGYLHVHVQYVHCTTGSLQKVRFPEKL